jgi:hypothetical protein
VTRAGWPYEEVCRSQHVSVTLIAHQCGQQWTGTVACHWLLLGSICEPFFPCATQLNKPLPPALRRLSPG